MPFYRELAGKVLEFEERQDELIDVLREMQEAGLKVVPIEDDLSRTERVLFTEIDPFTFMATFSRSGDKTATELCDWIRKRWNLETPTPTDFDGRANVAAVGGASWFFTSSEYGRTPQDIPSLWMLAKAIYHNGAQSLTEELYGKCVMLKNVGVLKLSTGLFWFNPREFLPLVGPTLPYLRKNGVKWDEKLLQIKPHCKLSEYLALMEKARAFNSDFVSLSHRAWLDKNASQITVAAETEVPIIEEMIEPAKMPLNQILYGPPGTGKTYNSIRRAVQVIDGKVGEDPKARFEELRKAGQIEFVTFHQSFSYEEFIEGLRPLIGEEGEQVSYEIRAGVLRKMALAAISEGLEKTDAKRATFEQVWNAFLEKVERENWLLQGIGSSQYKVVLTAAGNITGENVNGNAQQPYNGSRAKIEKVWEKLRDGPIATHALIIGILRVGSHSNLIGAVVEELKRIEAQLPKSQLLSTALAKSEIAAQSFLLGSSDYRANFQNAKKFVLIIDEINRGNISKILGELITLLEDDKRIGAPNELRLTLPTSGETFALPPNLYILGTMNTSDKSLAQLDVALRRRFDFEEMAPDLKLCAKFAAQIPVLEELNNRLEWALDREHRLGHAYFMNVTSEDGFNQIFRLKILPLLLEYFPHDFGTLRAVLGEKSDGFLREMKNPEGFTSGKKYRWWFESGVEEFSAFTQLKSNYGL